MLQNALNSDSIPSKLQDPYLQEQRNFHYLS